MRKELEVAAKNTTWRYIWLRAIYVDGPNTLECAIFHESLMWEKCADKSRSLPFIRIRYNLSTLGTSLPRFDTVSDVESYYRDPSRIAEIANLCEFWLSQFEEKAEKKAATQKAATQKAEKKGAEYYLAHPDELRALLSAM